MYKLETLPNKSIYTIANLNVYKSESHYIATV